MNTTSQFSNLMPVAQSERIKLLDILRGFALCGILLMNIEWFNRPIVDLLQFDFTQTGVDWGASFLIKVLVEGKFYKLFSLLFGMGFAIMLLRAKQQQRPFTAWFVRRMVVLFIFGMLHMIFFWGGDILHDYAVGGLFLLAIVLLLQRPKFQQYQQPTAFAKIALWLLLMPMVIFSVVGLFMGASHDNLERLATWQQESKIYQQVTKQFAQRVANNELTLKLSDAQQALLDAEQDSLTEEQQVQAQVLAQLQEKLQHQQEVNEEIAAVTQASFWQTTLYRLKYAFTSLLKTIPFALFVGLPIFLLGYWLVASKRITQPLQHKSFFVSLTLIGLVFGLFFNVILVALLLHPAVKQSVNLLGMLNMAFYYAQYLLAAGYFGAIVLLCLSAKCLSRLAWFAPLGQMALTNYIMHSLILSLLFYGYGFAEFGKIERGMQVLIVVAILTAQMVFCRLWLKVFKFGPLEWLWRCLSYQQWFAIKSNQVSQV